MTAISTPGARVVASVTEANSLPALLLTQADRRPSAIAMRKKDLGRWREYRWSEYADRAARVGMGLAALGVKPGDRVAIHSENRPAWLLTDVAVQGLGAVTVGVYPTSPAAEVEYLLSHSGSVVLIAEDEEQLDKVMEVRSRLPELKRIVVVDTRGVRVLDDPLVMTFAELEAMGEGAEDTWKLGVTSIDPSTAAVMVYTSGTTGPPKGAMLSHNNLMAAARSFNDVFAGRPNDEVLSYLPLCHIAERLASAINALYSGYTVNFGEGGETFAVDLREIQPTFFLGVPRVWEKMLAGVQIRMQDASRLKRFTFAFWTKVGGRIARKRMRGRFSPIDRLVYLVGWFMVFRSLRQKLGLGRVRVAVSGAAPIAPQVLEFFWSLGVGVREGYGQTENTALATYSPRDDVRIGKVGRAVPSVELKLADDGEILTRSPGVFLGYFKNDAATAEAVDADGWLHTGDVGELDSDGFLSITDRKKDIIITAGGKNISPSEIENRLKVSPFIREAIVIGDRRKFLSALIGIELDTVGNWATRRSIAYTTYRDLAAKPEVKELVQGLVAEVNGDLAQVEEIKKFALLPKELDPEDGELTATQKVKRSAIEREFAELIEGLYQ